MRVSIVLLLIGLLALYFGAVGTAGLPFEAGRWIFSGALGASILAFLLSLGSIMRGGSAARRRSGRTSLGRFARE